MMAQCAQYMHDEVFLVIIGQWRASSGAPFSTSTIFSEGLASDNRCAAINPPMPPPMMATSYVDRLLFMKLPHFFRKTLTDYYTTQPRRQTVPFPFAGLFLPVKYSFPPHFNIN
jgi:hypothetical protein